MRKIYKKKAPWAAVGMLLGSACAAASMKQRLAIALALTLACGSDDTTIHGEETAPDEEAYLEPGEPDPTVLAFLDAYQAENGAFDPAAPLTYDGDIYDGVPADEDGIEEKGQITALQGWGVKGVLAFQDGVHQVIGGVTYADFCWGVPGQVCDNEWHMQARDTNIDSIQDFAMGAEKELIGRCNGSNPCLLPRMDVSLGDRQIEWRFDTSACSNADGGTGRTLLREGIVQALTSAAVWLGTGIKWVEVTASENVLFKCDGAFPGVLGYMTPQGSLKPAWGAPFNVRESCETPSIAPSTRSYIQVSDLYYTYFRATVGLGENAIWTTTGNCGATDPVLIRRLVRNVVLHEIGHYFGLQHQVYNDPDLGVMANPPSCDSLRGRAMGYHPLVDEMIWEMNTSTVGSLAIQDNDISCFGPETVAVP